MYNSKANSNQNDADETIIDPEMLYHPGDKPVGGTVVSRMKNPRSIVHQSKGDRRDDYVYIEHERYKIGDDLMSILDRYRLDLTEKSKDQRDCDQDLIVRLTDYIRSIVSSDAKKLQNLEVLYEEISGSTDIRFIEQKEKQEQLNDEMIHLKKLIITPANEPSMNNIHRLNSMVNYQQWVEMEEESKELYQLIETQREKISELAKLLTQKDRPSASETRQQPSKHTTAVTTDEHRSTGKKTPAVPVPPIPPRRSRVRSSNEVVLCPLCKYQFPKGLDEFELDEHIEQCAKKSPPPSPDSDQFKCPVCAQQLPHDDQVYIQHVSKCFNERHDDF